MPKPLPNAILDVCDDPRAPPYMQAKDPNGHFINYWYQFSGGVDNQGKMRVSKANDGDSQMVVTSRADRCYTIQSVTFLDNGVAIPPGDPRFSAETIVGGYSSTITDWISKHPGDPTHDYEYRITVMDTRPNHNSQLIVADPTIQNRPVP
jgi:hypothetical protein